MSVNGTGGASLSPGTLEPQVLAILDTINRQGQLPALVEAYIAREEIDPQRFTPQVKSAMVEYLIDRGVQITDLQKLNDGNYDELFALAYEHAVSVSSSDADPLDTVRVRGARGTQAWDFTVETFDEIEEQGIISENILAAGAIDYIYELGERMNIFGLADALVLNWSAGVIDVVDGATANKLYRYLKLRDERSTLEERSMVYRRVLNKGSGNVLNRMVVNEHFPYLWENLMTEVAKFIDRSERVEEGRTETSPVSRARIFQATRELQYNLTEFCTGMAHIQAREMYAQLQEAIDILRDPDIIAHFGGTRRKTLWSVIEQLSKAEFGRSPNIGAIRALAVDGNGVFQWIADFNEASVRQDEFNAFLDAAESYILNVAGIGEEEPMMGEEEEEFEAFEEFEEDF